jgi:hypothetical protein
MSALSPPLMIERTWRERSAMAELEKEVRRERRASLMSPTATYFVASNCNIAFS